jgi:hypothetical protein
MTYHPSSAVSVVSIVSATVAVLLGYRAGRSQAAWKDLRDAKRAVHINRRNAWRHSLQLAVGVTAVLITLAVVAFDAGR